MSVLGAIGAGILGTFQAGIPQFAYGVYQDQRDYSFAQKQWDYQKALQERIFEREDTAVQRRRADLEAAGMNPNLAAGSAAGAGSVVGSNGKPSSHPLPSTDVLSAIVAFRQAALQKQQQEMNSQSIDQQRLDLAQSTVKNVFLNNPEQGSKLFVDTKGYIHEHEVPGSTRMDQSNLWKQLSNGLIESTSGAVMKNSEAQMKQIDAENHYKDKRIHWLGDYPVATSVVTAEDLAKDVVSGVVENARQGLKAAADAKKASDQQKKNRALKNRRFSH